MQPNQWNVEAPLTELLADPITRLVMDSDQVSEQAVRDALAAGGVQLGKAAGEARPADETAPGSQGRAEGAIRTSLRSLHAYGKRHLRILYGVAMDRRVPWVARLPSLAAIGYLLSPIDLIPDWIPGLGYLDDIAVVIFASFLTVRLIPGDLLAEYSAARPCDVSFDAPASEWQGADEDERKSLDGRILYWTTIGVGVAITLVALLALYGMDDA